MALVRVQSIHVCMLNIRDEPVELTVRLLLGEATRPQPVSPTRCAFHPPVEELVIFGTYLCICIHTYTYIGELRRARAELRRGA